MFAFFIQPLAHAESQTSNIHETVETSVEATISWLGREAIY